MGETLNRKLDEEMRRLGPRQRQRLLEFARALSRSRSRGTPGAGLVRFAGSIRPADLETMASEIEAGCEKVHTDGW